jgi:proteasome lid subunit RPN8/RPN11
MVSLQPACRAATGKGIFHRIGSMPLIRLRLPGGAAPLESSAVCSDGSRPVPPGILSVPALLLDEIRRHGQGAYPEECCGLLIGLAGPAAKRVVALRRAANARENSRHNRYEIAPGELLEAEKAALASGLDIIGFYHSHPDHPSRPSVFDREHAIPWYSYVILSVTSGAPAELTSWTLRKDRSGFDEETIEAGEDPVAVA